MFRNLLYIRKSDRITLLALLTLLVLVLVLIWLTGSDSQTSTPPGFPDSTLIDTADRPWQHTPREASGTAHSYYRQPEAAPAALFPFDPNTADSTQLLRLGLRPWQVRNIYKYRAAGGIYRQPGDFARLYGLTTGEYRRLKPYIRIGSDYSPSATLAEAQTAPAEHRDSLRYPVKLQPTETLDLNTADTTLLCRVPGIGHYFAARIVAYRQRLGGFVSVEQLDEIEDFPQASKAYFVVGSTAPKKLKINKMTLQELKRHPYLSFYQAKAIIDYRRLHGPLHSLADLSLSRDFPPEAIQRLAPYVEY